MKTSPSIGFRRVCWGPEAPKSWPFFTLYQVETTYSKVRSLTPSTTKRSNPVSVPSNQPLALFLLSIRLHLLKNFSNWKTLRILSWCLSSSVSSCLVSLPVSLTVSLDSSFLSRLYLLLVSWQKTGMSQEVSSSSPLPFTKLLLRIQ